VILLDTHIWVWWVADDPALTAHRRARLQAHEPTGLGVSVISCWEVAMLVAGHRLALPMPVDDWVRTALAYPGVQLLSLSPEIAIESTRLPDPFHKDPADRMLVATASLLDIEIVTEDRKILAYPHVRCLP